MTEATRKHISAIEIFSCRRRDNPVCVGQRERVLYKAQRQRNRPLATATPSAEDTVGGDGKPCARGRSPSSTGRQRRPPHAAGNEAHLRPVDIRPHRRCVLGGRPPTS